LHDDSAWNRAMLPVREIRHSAAIVPGFIEAASGIVPKVGSFP